MSEVIKEITLPYKRYSELLEAERYLAALEAAGVDNWEGMDSVEWDEDDD